MYSAKLRRTWDDFEYIITCAPKRLQRSWVCFIDPDINVLIARMLLVGSSYVHQNILRIGSSRRF